MTDKKSIVILGAGFGGMKAAFELHKELKRLSLLNQYEIFLVDRNSYHTYTPILYEIATTSKEVAGNLRLKEISAFDVREIVEGSGIKFIKADIKEIDLIGGDVHFANGTDLRFNYLLIAIGSTTNYFDIPGMSEYSLPLKTFTDALKMRDKIIELIASGKKNIKILIGGGGTTGVEVAGELRGWISELNKELSPCAAEISIIEASPTVLPGFSEKIISLAQKRLKNLGIKLSTNESINQALPDKIILKSKAEIHYDILIWTGGVKASPIISRLPIRLDRRGRIEVGSGLECISQNPNLKLYGKIYGIGDAVCCYSKSGKPMPGTAQTAIIQGGIAAKNIVADITSRSSKKYISEEHSYVIPIGGKWAIAQIGPVIIKGFLGWILKGLVELNYLRSIMPVFKAIKIWLCGLVIFIKNDRLG